MNASIEDVVLLADSEQSKFDDIHVITTKGHFLEQILHELPYETLIMDDKVIESCVKNAINTSHIEVYEFVDFSTTPITVCIDTETINEETVAFAAERLVEALEACSERKGVYKFGNAITYTLPDVAHLLNWH